MARCSCYDKIDPAATPDTTAAGGATGGGATAGTTGTDTNTHASLKLAPEQMTNQLE